MTSYDSHYEMKNIKSNKDFNTSNQNSLLHWSLIDMVRWDLYQAWLAYSISQLLLFMQVIFLRNYIYYLTLEEIHYPYSIVCAVGTLFCTFFGPLMDNHSKFFEASLKTKISQTLRILTFEKLMTSSPTFINMVSHGPLFNMILSDIERVALYYGSLSVIFTLPMIIIFYFGYLIYKVGRISVLIAPLFILFFLALYLINLYTHKLDLKLRGLTQRGMNMLSELVINLRPAKINSLEPFFEKKILQNKKDQLKFVTKMKAVQQFSNFLVSMAPAVSSVIILSVYILNNDTVDVTTGLFLIVFIRKLQRPLSDLIIHLVRKEKARISLRIFSDFLHISWGLETKKFECYKEKENLAESSEYLIQSKGRVTFIEEDDKALRARVRLLFERFSLSSLETKGFINDIGQHAIDKEREVLQIQNLEIKHKSKVCIMGLKNSGKNLFFKALKGELKPLSGELNHQLSTSFIDFSVDPQQLFMHGKSIKNNIILDQHFDKSRLELIFEILHLNINKYSGSLHLLLAERGENIEPEDRYLVLLARLLYPARDLYMVKGLFNPQVIEKLPNIFKIFSKILHLFLINKSVIYDSNMAIAAELSTLSLLFENGTLINSGPFKEIKISQKEVMMRCLDETIKKKGGFLKVIDQLIHKNKSNISKSKSPKSEFSYTEEVRAIKAFEQMKYFTKKEKDIKDTNIKFNGVTTTYLKSIISGLKIIVKNHDQGKSIKDEKINLDFKEVLNYFIFLKGQLSILNCAIILAIFLIIKTLGDLYIVPWSSSWFGDLSPVFYLLIYIAFVFFELACLLLVLKAFNKQFIRRSWILFKLLIAKLSKTEISWFIENPSSFLLTQLFRDHSIIDNKVADNIISCSMAFGQVCICLTFIMVCYPGASLIYYPIFLIWRHVYFSKLLKIVTLFALENSKRTSKFLLTFSQSLDMLDQSRTTGTAGFLRTDMINASNLFQQSFSHIYNFSFRWIKVRLIFSDFINICFSMVMTLLIVYFWNQIQFITQISTKSVASFGMAFTIKFNQSYNDFWISLTLLISSIVSIASVVEFVEHNQVEEDGPLEKGDESVPLVSVQTKYYDESIIIMNNGINPKFKIKNQVSIILESQKQEAIDDLSKIETHDFKAPMFIAVFGQKVIDQVKFYNFIGGTFSNSADNQDNCDNYNDDFEESVLFMGHRFKDWNKKNLRSYIFALEGQAFIFGGSIRDNLDPFNNFSTGYLIKVLSYIGFYDLIKFKVKLKSENQQFSTKGSLMSENSEFDDFIDRLQISKGPKEQYKERKNNKISDKISNFLQRQDPYKHIMDEVSGSTKYFQRVSSFDKKKEMKKIEFNAEQIKTEESNFTSSSFGSHLLEPATSLEQHTPSKGVQRHLRNILDKKLIFSRGTNIPKEFKRLILIGRCLLRSPKILLIKGEALDIRVWSGSYYLKLLKMNLKKSLIFCFPRSVKNTPLFDKVIYLKNGQICEIGDTQLIFKMGTGINRLLSNKSISELNKVRYTMEFNERY